MTHRAAPQLLFDDGSRAMIEQDDDGSGGDNADAMAAARDPHIPIQEYYEVDRLVQELNSLKDTVVNENQQWRNRIALQFPDELLSDAPDVCGEFEHRLGDDALVFVLGDTTYQSCCPDVVAARHLDADCIIHYGHACLSHSTLPVLYSFGRQSISIEKAVQAVKTQKEVEEATANNLLVLYEVKYAHAIDQLREALEPHFDSVVVGRIPASHRYSACSQHRAEESSPETGAACPCSTTSTNGDNATTYTTPQEVDESSSKMILGGLEIPPCDRWSQTTLLFIGQDEASRPLQNIMLRFLTDSENAPVSYWTWNPFTETLSTQVSPKLSRILSRRFYLMNKVKLAKIVGILVANPSDQTTRPVVRQLQALLQAHGAAQYNFMVGKLNPNKLANFGEIDAYCLLACEEHALLENERSDYAIPILTPLEIAMALGGLEWGSLPYSLAPLDFLKEASRLAERSAASSRDDNDDADADAPYFNPATGRYEASGKQSDDQLDLTALPGKGQITTYESAAADFLRQRTYQGLTVDVGETEVQAAVPGQQGIASDYGNR